MKAIKNGCLLVSILSGQDVQAGYRRVYIRFRDCDLERLAELKEELKAKPKPGLDTLRE